MSTLTYDQRTDVPAAQPSDRGEAGKSFWRRAFEHMLAARQRRAEREIAAYIASRGGHLTDELERDLMRSLQTGSRIISRL